MEKELSRMQVIDLIAEAILNKMETNNNACDMITNSGAIECLRNENKALKGILDNLDNYIKEEI